MNAISTPERAEQLAGHYSQALVHEGIVYVSGITRHRPGDR